MRLYWGFALCAVLAFMPPAIASADYGLHISLAYQVSNDGAGHTCTLPNVAVPGSDATLTQVSLAPGGPWVNHVFNVYATVTGLSADQDVTFMLFTGAGSAGVTRGTYTPNSYPINPPSMGPPTSDAPAASWSDFNGLNSGGTYVVSLTTGTSTGGAQGNTYGDYAAYMQLGEPTSPNAPGPFLIGQQVLSCNSSGTYSFTFIPNEGYFQIISGNTNGAATGTITSPRVYPDSESYPAYSGFGDTALFAPRNATDLTWANGATATWAVADGTNHWTQTANPSTSDNFYHLDTVRFTSNTVANRTVTLAGALNPASVIVDSSDDYAFTGSGCIVGAGTTLLKAGTGKLTVGNTGTNTYSGPTTITGGVLQAADGTALPTASNLVLNGGVWMTSGATTFTRALGTGSNQVQWGADGGGFSAGGRNGAIGDNDLAVSIGGGGTLDWGDSPADVGSKIVGSLMLGDPTYSNKITTFQNAIALNGNRTVEERDAPTLPVGDTYYGVLSGVISNGAVTGSTLTKTGAGSLVLTGANTFTGKMVVEAGTLALNHTGGTATGYALVGDLVQRDGTTVIYQASYQLGPASRVSFSGTDDSHNILNGTTQITAGVSAANGPGNYIENTLSPTVPAGDGTLIVMTAGTADTYAFGGLIRDADFASGTKLNLIKDGPGAQTLSGTCTYTGLTTLRAGILQLNGASAQNPVLNLGGSDIQKGKMVFDYNGTGETDPALTTILPDLIASYNGGTNSWTAGKFQSSTAVANGTTLGWIDDPVTKQVTVMATISGDFNLDGTVNLTDLAILRTGFGGGTTWAAGDVNYDGVVNLTDLAILRANFGKSIASGPVAGAGVGSPVPEPGTLALLGCGLFGLLAYARRKRR